MAIKIIILYGVMEFISNMLTIPKLKIALFIIQNGKEFVFMELKTMLYLTTLLMAVVEMVLSFMVVLTILLLTI